VLAKVQIHTTQLAQGSCDVFLADGVLHLSDTPNTQTRVAMKHVSSVSANDVCVLTCTQEEAVNGLCEDHGFHEHDASTASDIVEETSLAYTAQKQDLAGMSHETYCTGGKMLVSGLGKLPMWTMLASPTPDEVLTHTGFLLRLAEVRVYLFVVVISLSHRG
jgi:hypothetical protein